MSHSRQTEHYELPLYDGNDIINPLTDFNNANNSIDEALYNANQRSVGAETTANEAKDIAEGYDTRVSQAIQTANDAMTLANNTQDMIADDFDPNKAGGYKVGDFVIYNGKLYRFINAHTGAWDASDVQVSPVLIEAIADVVDEGKQAINDAVEEAEQEIAGQTEKVTKTQAMIAQPFDANKSGGYAVGDVVTYADKLYKFTSAHSGAWTGLDVTQTNVIEYDNDISVYTNKIVGTPSASETCGSVLNRMYNELITKVPNLENIERAEIHWKTPLTGDKNIIHYLSKISLDSIAFGSSLVTGAGLSCNSVVMSAESTLKLFTVGSTGSPKAIDLTNLNMSNNDEFVLYYK